MTLSRLIYPNVCYPQVPGEPSFTDEEWSSEIDWIEHLSLEDAQLIFAPHAIDSPFQVTLTRFHAIDQPGRHN